MAVKTFYLGSGSATPRQGGALYVTFNFTPAVNFSSGSKVKIHADVTIANASPDWVVLQINLLQNNSDCIQEITRAKQTSNTLIISYSKTLTSAITKNVQCSLRFLARGQAFTSGTLTVTNARVVLGSADPVIAGNIIYKTDFDSAGQSATVGDPIQNPNFNTGDTITASAWNAKWS